MMINYNTTAEEMIERGQVDCTDCTHCCRFHGGFVLPHEISRMARHLDIADEKFKEKYLEDHTQLNTTIFRFKSNKEKIGAYEKPYGPCIFLEKKGCKINEVKPLHCRIGTCKEGSEEHTIWYRLNHFLNTQDQASMKDYAMYLKTGGKTLPGAYLHQLIPDKEKLDKLMRYKNINDLDEENKEMI